MMRMKEASLAYAARVARVCCVVACIGSANLLAGCATSEEALKKSEGYYQEGVASLSGDRQKAFVSFQKSVQLNPNNKESWYALGHIYTSQGKLTQAEESFKAAIAIDETFSEAYNYLGQVLVSQNRWEEAIKAYRQALSNPILVPILKDISWSYIFYMAAIGTGWLFFLNLFVQKEPKSPASTKTLGEVFGGMVKVLTDWRFILMIVIYSGFWILYFQMFDTVQWYLKEHMDLTPVDNLVNGILGIFMANPNWKFDAEHVTVINAGTIIVLQLIISNIVKHTKALPTMIVGISLGTIGMAILAISTHAWVFMAGIIIFSIGEMTAHPKFISYVGLIAPEDKKALYLGYSFL